MKINIKAFLSLTVLLAASFSACKKEYFNRPPKSQITLDNYYQTAEQVRTSTTILYSAPWFGYCTKGGWAITEISGGNGRTWSPDIINFQDFSVTGTNFEISSVWNSLFIEVAQANGIINNLPTKVPSSVDQAVVKNALGEAHLWRALAYFHLVRIFGPVPIIENSLDYVDNYQVNRHVVTDVYKFIVNDLKYAEANCSPAIRTGSSPSNARVSSGSASALLAKVYLYMQDYTNARAQAEKVIASKEFKLYGIDVPGKTFSDLFLTANNNNEESIVALQWTGSGGYGRGNPFQGAVALNGIITGTGDGYGQMAPTFDLMDKFDATDLRRKPTYMIPGDKYNEINQASGGYTVPSDANSQGTHAQVKKYIVGTPADNGGVGGAQSSANNTYMMRYADVYLILAEAVMAGAKTSTDPVALNAINTIRRRAGLSNLTVIDRSGFVPNPDYTPGSNEKGKRWPTNYKDDLLDERRREFAFENDYFFDLMRLDGFNKTEHPIALQIIKQQDKGTSDNSNPPQRYGNGYLTNVTSANLLFPIPATEIVADPKLKDPPVAYPFK
ncbi:RagB/SusD family nutrient uptake outer membrane protein [Mucilaginibacter sp. PAMB04168]|uniref:RagB/SusD family nutrient uptake outer membrane protein n=1 Tax=Mucilaginibacter sp. PAMB04168 TaxID=3138567 RepID=UPI0031F6D44C